MSDSEDEVQYPFLGTPLDPIEEGDLPRKKPLLIQDQIATDKHGRRRFHGAFTGGFSAGHFNSVGTPEGWKPTSFKSSRSTKIDSKSQRPEDFMDDEDMDDFGIAPSVLRAKAEYSGAKSTKKRERVYFQEGPIPGDPVLQKILEPARNTVGVHLLMKMGWKPGQGIGPRISKIEKRLQKRRAKLEAATSSKSKVYGCSLKPPSSSEESDEGEEDLDVNVLFAPDDVEVIFSKPKSDTFGMGYSGLDRNPVLSASQSDPSRGVPDTFRMIDKNKKLAIRGQAFGVGAFEEEDADIYARDDMSQYDFALETTASLKEKRRLENRKNDQLAITGGEDVIEGFVPAKNPLVKAKYFPPPTLPPGYQPYHVPRKSRFGPEHPNIAEVKNKSRTIDSEDRSVILGEKSSSKRETLPCQVQEETQDEMSDLAIPQLPPPDPKDDLNFRPFVGDPPKQARYEKYLQFVKIGAKDAFRSIQPKTMSEWERERERTEFEQAAKLYRPLSGMMADRFARAELPDESLDPLKPVAKMVHGVPTEMIEAAKSKMFGKLTRKVEDWVPVALLCKRMNVTEPVNRGGKSLCEIAKDKSKTKSKFSVFDILANSDNPFKNFENKEESPEPNAPTAVQEEAKKIEQTVNEQPVAHKQQNITKQTPESDISETLKAIRFDDLAEKRDLFKAIFCDSDDEEDSEETQPLVPSAKPLPTSASQQNLLRNTSPPRGIFANLNLDKMNAKSAQPMKPNDETISLAAKIFKNDLPSDNIDTSNKLVDQNALQITAAVDSYGPALPAKPVFIQQRKVRERSREKSTSDSSKSSSEDEWVEKDSSKDGGKSKKKIKKKKEHKKDKKKKKSKHKEHKRKHKEKRR